MVDVRTHPCIESALDDAARALLHLAPAEAARLAPPGAALVHHHHHHQQPPQQQRDAHLPPHTIRQRACHALNTVACALRAESVTQAHLVRRAALAALVALHAASADANLQASASALLAAACSASVVPGSEGTDYASATYYAIRTHLELLGGGSCGAASADVADLSRTAGRWDSALRLLLAARERGGTGASSSPPALAQLEAQRAQLSALLAGPAARPQTADATAPLHYAALALPLAVVLGCAAAVPPSLPNAEALLLPPLRALGGATWTAATLLGEQLLREWRLLRFLGDRAEPTSTTARLEWWGHSKRRGDGRVVAESARRVHDALIVDCYACYLARLAKEVPPERFCGAASLEGGGVQLLRKRRRGDGLPSPPADAKCSVAAATLELRGSASCAWHGTTDIVLAQAGAESGWLPAVLRLVAARGIRSNRLALLGAHALRYCEEAPEMLETMLAIHQPKPPRFPQWPQPRASTICDGDGSAATASLLCDGALACFEQRWTGERSSGSSSSFAVGSPMLVADHVRAREEARAFEMGPLKEAMRDARNAIGASTAEGGGTEVDMARKLVADAVAQRRTALLSYYSTQRLVQLLVKGVLLEAAPPLPLYFLLSLSVYCRRRLVHSFEEQMQNGTGTFALFESYARLVSSTPHALVRDSLLLEGDPSAISTAASATAFELLTHRLHWVLQRCPSTQKRLSHAARVLTLHTTPVGLREAAESCLLFFCSAAASPACLRVLFKAINSAVAAAAATAARRDADAAMDLSLLAPVAIAAISASRRVEVLLPAGATGSDDLALESKSVVAVATVCLRAASSDATMAAAASKGTVEDDDAALDYVSLRRLVQEATPNTNTNAANASDENLDALLRLVEAGRVHTAHLVLALAERLPRAAAIAGLRRVLLDAPGARERVERLVKAMEGFGASVGVPGAGWMEDDSFGERRARFGDESTGARGRFSYASAVVALLPAIDVALCSLLRGQPVAHADPAQPAECTDVRYCAAIEAAADIAIRYRPVYLQLHPSAAIMALSLARTASGETQTIRAALSALSPLSAEAATPDDVAHGPVIRSILRELVHSLARVVQGPPVGALQLVSNVPCAARRAFCAARTALAALPLSDAEVGAALSRSCREYGVMTSCASDDAASAAQNLAAAGRGGELAAAALAAGALASHTGEPARAAILADALATLSGDEPAASTITMLLLDGLWRSSTPLSASAECLQMLRRMDRGEAGVERAVARAEMAAAFAAPLCEPLRAAASRAMRIARKGTSADVAEAYRLQAKETVRSWQSLLEKMERLHSAASRACDDAPQCARLAQLELLMEHMKRRWL